MFIFDTSYVARYKDCYSVVSGGVEIAEAVISERFDYIFFTGSGSIGKRVMVKAAENLTPVTLELGGKRYGNDNCNRGEPEQFQTPYPVYTIILIIILCMYTISVIIRSVCIIYYKE